MPTERFSGVIPEWMSAAKAGYAFGRNARRDQALADVQREDAPDTDYNYRNTNPQDVGPQPMDSMGLESVRPSQMGPRPMDANGLEQVAPTSAPQPMASDTVARLSKLNRRANVYRLYGDDAEADRMLKSNADLGLTQAQTGETQQRTMLEGVRTKDAQLGLDIKERENRDNLSAQSIIKSTAAQLQGLTNPDGTPRAPTSDEVNANRLQQITSLIKAGHVTRADAEAKALKGFVGDQIEATKTQRNAALADLQRQVASGDLSRVSSVFKSLSLGLPGQASISSIQPGPQPGTSVITFTDQQGQKSKVVPTPAIADQIQRQIGMLMSDDTAAKKLAYETLDATIAAHKAQAQHSQAAAGEASARTTYVKEQTSGIQTENEHKKTLEDARSMAAMALRVAPEDRSPEEQQAIAAWDKLAADERGRGGNTKGESIRTVNAEIDGTKYLVREFNDGSSKYAVTLPGEKGKPGAIAWVTMGDVPPAGSTPVPRNSSAAQALGASSKPNKIDWNKHKSDIEHAAPGTLYYDGLTGQIKQR